MNSRLVTDFFAECAKRSFKRFKFVLLPVLLWVLLYRFALLPESYLEASALWIAAITFVLGLPLSLLFGIDILQDRYHGFEPSRAVLISLAVAYLNFFLLSVVRALWRKGIQKLMPPPVEDRDQSAQSADVK